MLYILETMSRLLQHFLTLVLPDVVARDDLPCMLPPLPDDFMRDHLLGIICRRLGPWELVHYRLINKLWRFAIHVAKQNVALNMVKHWQLWGDNVHEIPTDHIQ